MRVTCRLALLGRESQQAALATKLSDLHVQAFDVLHR